MPADRITPRTDVARVLVMTAHPDDVDHGASGTVASWTAAGVEVGYRVCTSGDVGGFDDFPPRAGWPGCAKPSSGRRPSSSE